MVHFAQDVHFALGVAGMVGQVARRFSRKAAQSVAMS
jgi:hypothetical protein